ncbi:ABC transporter ATP-binding protein [Devosia sp. YIM 151766]|uniref:ABC transporter ATP-binding protein n=1 Tax=Devosia sp. YIM 151766 TaxID=3017325 RepID=UPI00255CA359|nr:ABC transporter ATP-binding protein [Devosia sp. YIM 151766]WIY53905.1 ABC transporter ATP-binding protein [Devosia sp. YIM 151766]
MTQTAAAIASLRDVNMTFDLPDGGHTQALKNVTVELRAGELLVFVGRSGSGKTTALNVLAGLTRPTSGAVEVLGDDPRNVRKQIGYMFARDALLPWRSAERNVEYGLELRGVNAAERRQQSGRFLDMVGLGAYKGNFPSQLSQGQRQRVALARTWVLAPKVLFMDEPFAALDAQTRESLHGEFLDGWQKQQQSVVFVTHDLSEAIAIADRIVVFAHGEIVREFEVPFPRPRDMLELPNDPEAREMIKEIRELLHD